MRAPAVPLARALLFLVGCFGLGFALVTPPLQAPDEIRHLSRIYGLSEGRILPEPGASWAGVRVPRSVASLQRRLSPGLAFDSDARQDLGRLRREFAQPLEPDATVLVRFASAYSPIPYLPAAVAVAGLRFFDAAPVLSVYAGRIVNLGIFAFLTWLALRVAPAHRVVILVVATLPISVFLAASLSTDGYAIAIALLFLALVVRAARRTETIERREALALAVVGAGIGLGKPVYAPLVLLALWIPAARFAKTSTPLLRTRALALVALFSLAALPVVIWFVLMLDFTLAPPTEGSDPRAQLAWIAAHPLDYARVSFATLGRYSKAFVLTGIGVLGHLDVRLPDGVYALYGAVVFSVAMVADEGAALPSQIRLGVIALAGLLVALVLTSAYVAWNPVGAETIHGVQGRYFLPFLPLVMMASGCVRGGERLRWLIPAWLLALGLGLASALLRVFDRYYGAA